MVTLKKANPAKSCQIPVDFATKVRELVGDTEFGRLGELQTVGPVDVGNAQKGGGPVSFLTVSAEVASP
jgi:hypothetical protein